MWKIHIKLKQIFAKVIYKDPEDETPILMDKYLDNTYYYILNNSENYIYSLDEIYELVKTSMKDPFTRNKIYKYSIVKIKIV